MKICIDISQIPYGTGVSVYTKELVRNLLKIDRKNQYILFAGYLRRKQDFLDFFDEVKQDNVELKLVPFPPSIADFVWNRLHIINIEKFVGKIDVYHSSDWAQAPSGAKSVTTVHDLAPILMPEHTPGKIVSVHRRRLYWVKNSLGTIVCPSKAVMKDLVNLGIDEKRINVVHEAASSEFKKVPKSVVDKTLSKFRIKGKYLLAIGTNPRKNLPRTIQAFHKSQVANKLDKLVVVGTEQNLAKDVIYTGKIPTKDLVSLYNGAAGLVYVSLSEGFGLPILEAFACGCPVLTSNVSSMPEVAGDAAVLVNPKSVSNIEDGIDEILSNGREHALKGLDRVKIFNWKKVAIRHIKLYN